MSPVQLLVALIHGGIHALTNRLPHTGYREQIEGLLNGRPVFLGYQNGLVALAHDDDRLVGLGRFIDQPVQIAARLGGGNAGHDAPLTCSLFDQCTPYSTYVNANVLSVEIILEARARSWG